MRTIVIRFCLALALIAPAMGSDSAGAQDFLNQDWVLDPQLSNVYLQTAKNNAIIETHKFAVVEGRVNKDADANVKISLESIDTGIDLRDVRMRFLLFETFKFPYAEISAKLDKAKLQALSTDNRLTYPLNLTLSMHGIVKEIPTVVRITRINDTSVSVATMQPIIVTAESFGLTAGIAKLAEAVGGIPIVSAASITFDLVFQMDNVGLEAARATREKNRAAEAASTISTEACETRFSVISKTGAIYFKTGSAVLDLESAPLLDSVVDIANRCPSVRITVEGDTDNVGSKEFNQRLSDARAKSVVDYLARKGVAAARIRSAGYGDTRPVAPNDTEANRAKNRRIEFKLEKI